MSTERHQLVKRIFLEACRREPVSRPEFVRQAAAGDEGVVREVEELLKHHTETTIIPSSPLDDTNRRRSKGSHSSRSRWTRGTVSRALGGWAEQLGTAGKLALGAAAMMLVVFALAWWSQREVDRLNRASWEDRLVKTADTAHEVVRQWGAAETRAVEALQASPAFRTALNQAISVPPSPAGAAPAVIAELEAAVRPFAGEECVFVVFNRRGMPAAIGGTTISPTVVQDAFREPIERISEQGEMRSLLLLPHQCHLGDGKAWFGRNTPMLGVLAPVLVNKQWSGAILIASPSRLTEFGRAMAPFRAQETGEAYLVTRDGRMINESRFRDDLIRAAILPERAATTVLMRLHDPGVDVTQGETPSRPYESHVPPTSVVGVMAGVDGVDVDGYRDYRGVPVIGAWKVDAENEYGIVVEIDRQEAFAAVAPLHSFFYARVVLTLAATGLVLWSWYSAATARRRLKSVMHIGAYMVEGLLGEGGMGRVYKARHVLLKRSTAVKVIKPELVNDRTTAWFEREVEVAGRLKHPNTVEIYDFGRSEQGQFYCAMEFLNGLNLAQVALMEGALPAERVIHVVLQAAHSLREAHRRGLIHRDVKPQNIMLCVLGGEVDVVKVLDFGLAKQYGGPADEQAADTKMLAGTPLYLAPERLLPPYAADARSDIYSLGLTAYKLMTGRDVFSGGSDLEVFHQTLNSPVSDPASVSPRTIPGEFSDLVMRCLAKDPEARPQSMRQVIEVLDRLALEFPWRQEDARRWWQLNADRVRELAPFWDADEELDWDAPTAARTAIAAVAENVADGGARDPR